MSDPARPTLQAIVDQARRATGASTAWLLACRPGGLEVMAGSGPTGPDSDLLAVAGARAYALSSGQAVALMPQPGDPASAGLGGATSAPGSVLLVPVAGWDHVPAVGSAGPVALLELADKEGARPFTLDDIGRVGLLAPVVAAALAEAASPGPVPGGPWGPTSPAPVPAPPALLIGLERLAGDDPACYAALAGLIRAVLGPR